MQQFVDICCKKYRDFIDYSNPEDTYIDSRDRVKDLMSMITSLANNNKTAFIETVFFIMENYVYMYLYHGLKPFEEPKYSHSLEVDNPESGLNEIKLHERYLQFLDILHDLHYKIDDIMMMSYEQ